MRMPSAVMTVLLLGLAAVPAGATSGVVSTRFDSGLDWILDKPRADAPVYPGFHGSLSADGRLYRRLRLVVAGSIDSYRYGAEQIRSEIFMVRAGPMVIPVDFDGGTGFVEATAGYARLHGADCLGIAGGLGYMAQYGRLGIGLFSRYQQIMVPAGWGHDVKALVFGVAAGVVLVHPYRPAPPSFEPPGDADGDGIEDSKDRCPGSRRGGRVAADGCETKATEEVAAEIELPKPEVKEKVAEPVVAGGDPPAPTPAVAAGPPPSDDDDQDGVSNDQDQCPATTAGFPVDIFNGCPVLRRRFALPQVTFVPGTARIEKAAHAQLDELLALVRERPGVRLRINGHVGSSKEVPARVAKRLSEQRAQVVAELLAARGIGAKRLKAAGSDKPDVDEIEVVVSGSTKVVKPKTPKVLAGQAPRSPPPAGDQPAPPAVAPVAPPPVAPATSPPPATEPPPAAEPSPPPPEKKSAAKSDATSEAKPEAKPETKPGAKPGAAPLYP
jgi:outer membrane protein OmpA-like peptidoglycan-associated protein